MSFICSNFAKYNRQIDQSSLNFRIMATPIRIIPTLYGKEAEAFEKAAREVEAHPHKKYDLTKEAKLIKAYLREMGF